MLIKTQNFVLPSRLCVMLFTFVTAYSPDNGEAATMLTSCCSNHTLPLTHYSLSTTGWLVVCSLFILRLARAVIQPFFWR